MPTDTVFDTGHLIPEIFLHLDNSSVFSAENVEIQKTDIGRKVLNTPLGRDSKRFPVIEPIMTQVGDPSVWLPQLVKKKVYTFNVFFVVNSNKCYFVRQIV